MTTITRATQTSIACPSQWDAWDIDGNYYYLRYRHGVGTVQRFPGGPNFWERPGEESELIARFEYGDGFDGHMNLDEFAFHSGISLGPDLQEQSYTEYLAAEMAQALKETYPEEWKARYGEDGP